MNIKERQRYLQSIEQWDVLLGDSKYIQEIENTKKEEMKKKIKFNWYGIVNPPLSHYLPNEVIMKLDEISNSVRLMNNPTKRYEVQNQILEPYGFRPLNSGTNRRAFYHVNDINVILKLGSDKIGKHDNIAEYNLQTTLAPFCTRVFDVSPTGVCQLAERVETITRDQFKDQYASEVFSFIIGLFYRGYIMEDVGANFFKNWGIRRGFGAVILDFPYVYEVDYSKLKCSKRDPFTNIQCDGYLDYDYDGGMSQLICEKCGARYSAKYLAKKIPSNAIQQIIRKKEYSMALFNDNVKVYVTETNLKTGEKKILHKYFNESDTRVPVQPRSNKSYIDKNIQQQERQNNYPRPVKRELNDFLVHIEDKYGKRIAVDMAKKLGIRYERNPKYEGEEEIKVEEDNSSPLSFKDKAQKFKNNYDNQQILKEEPYRLKEEPKKEEVPKPKFPDRPTTGLYPIKPKSVEEIEKEELESRNENVVTGFLGESGVEKLRRQEMIPKIKDMTIARFNGFVGNSNDEALGHKLAKEIKDFVSEDFMKLLGTLDGLEVTCTKTNDNINRICFDTRVTNYGSLLFDCQLYTKDELEKSQKKNNSINYIQDLLNPNLTTNAPNKEDKEDKKISDSLPMTENELRVFFEDSAINFDFDKYPARTKQMQQDLESFLLDKLADKITTVPFPLGQKKVKEYVETYYPEDTEDISGEL